MHDIGLKTPSLVTLKCRALLLQAVAHLYLPNTMGPNPASRL